METTPTPGQRVIIVGVDGSCSSVAALRLAASLMPLAGDRIDALAAWQHPLVFGPSTPLEDDYEDLAGQALDQAVTDAFPTGAPCVVTQRVRHGLATEILIEESRHASMVVLGSRGRGGFNGLLLGSVSSAVVERAECPVLVSHGAVQLPGGAAIAVPTVGASV